MNLPAPAQRAFGVALLLFFERHRHLNVAGAVVAKELVCGHIRILQDIAIREYKVQSTTGLCT